MILRLNRADVFRPVAERAIDEHFSLRINEVLGPMASVHLLKRMGRLVDGDEEAIAARAADQDAIIMGLDAQRRGLKDAVRAAATEEEIRGILSANGIRITERGGFG